MPPSPNRPETTTATPTSPRPAHRARRARSRGGDEHPAGRAEDQRDARQRGDHEPGQHRVRERLGGVGAPQQQDPDAERAAGERRARSPRANARCMIAARRSEQSVAVVVVGDGHGPAGAVEDHELVAVGRAAAPRCVSVSSGAPNATWPWLRHSTRRPGARLARRRAWRPAARGPRRCSSAKTRSICAALGRSTPDSGSSSSSTGASCTSARAISTRWRWPPESVAEARRARGRRARRAPAPRPPRSRSARRDAAGTTACARRRPSARRRAR